MLNGNEYVLGDSTSERQRLGTQAKRLESLTQRLLTDAGILSGMRVLELGCGPGYMTELLAERVGPGGRVVALERSSAMIGEARQRFADHRWSNVEFLQCDVTNPTLSVSLGPFDALLGRLILMHLPDPADVLRRALDHLRPGGIVAFQEADYTLSDHLLQLKRDRLPLTYQICSWIQRAHDAGSRNPHLGLQLDQVFRRAGLPGPTMHMETELHAGVSMSRIRNTVTILRNLLPRLEEFGIGSQQIGFDTLEERLMAELSRAEVVQAFASIVSAWAVKKSGGATQDRSQHE